MKADCYKCKFRGDVPGDAHSCCHHPKNGKALDDPMLKIMAIFAGVHRSPPMAKETGLNIRANAIGLQRGWFNWPWNFDPVWLENCDGFEAKEGA